MSAITIQIVNTASAAYEQVWQVREEVLRKPLGMSLKNEDLSMDTEDFIFTATADDKVIGCVMLHPVTPDVMKLRQMAVYDEWQGKGVGRLLVQTAETYVKDNNYKKIILHARMVAVDFYSKMEYTITSAEFTEVGIPHMVMEKEM